jgi:hypothetical protein
LSSSFEFAPSEDGGVSRSPKVCGVRLIDPIEKKEHLIKTKLIICDPSYLVELSGIAGSRLRELKAAGGGGAEATTATSDADLLSLKQQTALPNAKLNMQCEIVRAICILKKEIPNTEDGTDSCQIILTAKEMKRKSDIYISMVSSSHKICPKGKYIAMISTRIETNDPEKEIKPAIKILGGKKNVRK